MRTAALVTMAIGALAAGVGGCASTPDGPTSPARQPGRALVLGGTCDGAVVLSLSAAFAGRSDTCLGAFRDPLARPAVGLIDSQQRLRIIDGRPHEHTWFRWREWQEVWPAYE